MEMVWCVVGLYLLAGVYLVSKGPLGKWMGQRQVETWFDYELDAWVAEGNGEQRSSPTDARVRKLSLAIRVLAVLVWPLLLPGALRKRQAAVDVAEEVDMPPPETEPEPAVHLSPRQALKFMFMSGTGEVSCLACGHKERMAGAVYFRSRETGGSVIHSGYQCQTCRKFDVLVMRDGLAPDLQCACGGEMSREEVLLCPACASQNLEYECFLMT